MVASGSTFWQTEAPDKLADHVGDDGVSNPTEPGTRGFRAAKDPRDELPPVIIEMAVTRDGVPVRLLGLRQEPTDMAIVSSSRTTRPARTCADSSGSPTAASPPPPTASA